MALRHALDAPVLILKGDQPDALLVHFSRSLSLLILDVKVRVYAMVGTLRRHNRIALWLAMCSGQAKPDTFI